MHRVSSWLPPFVILVGQLLGSTSLAADYGYDYSQSLDKLKDPALRARIEQLDPQERRLLNKYGLDALPLLDDGQFAVWKDYALKTMQVERRNDEYLAPRTSANDLTQQKAESEILWKLEQGKNLATLRPFYLQKDAAQYELRRPHGDGHDFSEYSSGKPWYMASELKSSSDIFAAMDASVNFDEVPQSSSSSTPPSLFSSGSGRSSGGLPGVIKVIAFLAAMYMLAELRSAAAFSSMPTYSPGPAPMYEPPSTASQSRTTDVREKVREKVPVLVRR